MKYVSCVQLFTGRLHISITGHNRSFIDYSKDESESKGIYWIYERTLPLHSCQEIICIRQCYIQLDSQNITVYPPGIEKNVSLNMSLSVHVLRNTTKKLCFIEPPIRCLFRKGIHLLNTNLNLLIGDIMLSSILVFV